MSLAIYRKYRPKTFKELVGQESNSEIFRNAAKQDRIAHAYLLYGARGTGKTSAARLVAKVANCETRQTDKKFHSEGEPCNKCRVCNEIDDSNALDVVEIDAASNRGIDEMRDLKESTKLAPTSYKYKTFIVDEAHMLTPAAFNALLKTLEEPPHHVIIILATTEFEKVPSTISSRTQKFHFKKLSLKEILDKLSAIVKSEKIEIEKPALELIASAGEGSLRDAESLIDQLASYEEKISEELVEKNLGRTGLTKIIEFSDILFASDLPSALSYIEKIDESGHNLPQFNKELIHYLRKVLALHFDSSLEKILKNELSSDELSSTKRHSGMVDEKKHINLLKSLIEAYGHMRYSPFAIAPLEVAIIENLRKED